MSVHRICSRETCENLAIATMTYDYAKALAVIGALSPTPIAGAFDLCEQHAASITVPVGWELVHLTAEYAKSAAAIEKEAAADGVTALADALREAEKEAQRMQEKRSRATGNLRNPWESHVTIPTARPRLSVISGGAAKPKGSAEVEGSAGFEGSAEVEGSAEKE